MAEPRRKCWVTALIAAALIAIAVIYALNSAPSNPPQGPPSQPSTPATTTPGAPVPGRETGVKACGPVDTDDITLVYRQAKDIAPTNPYRSRASTEAKVHTQAIAAATFYPWGCPTKQSGCRYGGAHQENPDFACSPGAIYDLTSNQNPAKYDEKANQDLICATRANAGSGSDSNADRRDVSNNTKTAVWASYGQTKQRDEDYETDHIIPLSIGGSNTPANLFPQWDNGANGFNEKDKVEAALARDICEVDSRGNYRLPLHVAQHQVVYEWKQLYDNWVASKRFKPTHS